MPDTDEYSRVAIVVDDLPPYRQLAEAIWGVGVDFDSDGDSSHPDATGWRELTLTLRPHDADRLDIDPMEGATDTIRLRATSQVLLGRAIAFLESTGSIRIVER